MSKRKRAMKEEKEKGKKTMKRREMRDKGRQRV